MKRVLAAESGSPRGHRALLLVRRMVGVGFLSEGIQRILFPADLGMGRFVKIGLPAPEVLARLAAPPPVAEMGVAIASTEVPILLRDRFWTMAHESRTDRCMILGRLFLAWVGPGARSLDSWSRARRGPR
ncbi:MAG TPA: DoxX family protein [Candidatus Eisenbacteria bacterium]